MFISKAILLATSFTYLPVQLRIGDSSSSDEQSKLPSHNCCRKIQDPSEQEYWLGLQEVRLQFRSSLPSAQSRSRSQTHCLGMQFWLATHWNWFAVQDVGLGRTVELPENQQSNNNRNIRLVQSQLYAFTHWEVKGTKHKLYLYRHRRHSKLFVIKVKTSQ